MAWALGMVWTRAFAFGSSLAMVPYLDLFNHWIPKKRHLDLDIQNLTKNACGMSGEDPLWSCRLVDFGDAVGEGPRTVCQSNYVILCLV